MGIEKPSLANGEHLKEILFMQEELAKMYYGFESSDSLIEWINKHSEDFRILIKARPELIDEYNSDPKATLKKIEPLLYEKSPKDGIKK